MPLPLISDAQIICFPKFTDGEASLFVYDYQVHVPFDIKRVFIISADQLCIRGYHAHRECKQLLIGINGSIEVTIKDGSAQRTLILDRANQGVYIPPGLWAEQRYQPGSITMVLADQSYDENDYIREYDDFICFRKGKA